VVRRFQLVGRERWPDISGSTTPRAVDSGFGELLVGFFPLAYAFAAASAMVVQRVMGAVSVSPDLYEAT